MQKDEGSASSPKGECSGSCDAGMAGQSRMIDEAVWLPEKEGSWRAFTKGAGGEEGGWGEDSLIDGSSWAGPGGDLVTGVESDKEGGCGCKSGVGSDCAGKGSAWAGQGKPDAVLAGQAGVLQTAWYAEGGGDTSTRKTFNSPCSRSGTGVMGVNCGFVEEYGVDDYCHRICYDSCARKYTGAELTAYEWDCELQCQAAAALCSTDDGNEPEPGGGILIVEYQ